MCVKELVVLHHYLLLGAVREMAVRTDGGVSSSVGTGGSGSVVVRRQRWPGRDGVMTVSDLHVLKGSGTGGVRIVVRAFVGSGLEVVGGLVRHCGQRETHVFLQYFALGSAVGS